MIISAAQIRAARGLLDWTREDLAREAGLSSRTIRNLEKGYISPRDATATGLHKAFDNAGIIFPPEGGVRQEIPDVKSIEGQDGIDILFETLLHTAQKQNDEIVGVFTSPKTIRQSFALQEDEAYDRLSLLAQHTHMKFILADLNKGDQLSLRSETRTVSDYCIGPNCTLVCGNKYVIIQNVGQHDHRNIIINDPRVSIASKEHFYKLWDVATPLIMPAMKHSIEKQYINSF